jgi:GT2 family glycosyltransferase
VSFGEISLSCREGWSAYACGSRPEQVAHPVDLVRAMATQMMSVVIPTRDTMRLTLRCLETLAACRPEEMIVVDDGGSDATSAAIRESFPDVRLIRLDVPRGFTRAANRGLSEAQGEILLLLNSDTELERRSLDALRAAMRSDPRLGVAGGNLRFPDGTPQWSGGREPTATWLFGLASGLPELLARVPGYRAVRPVSGGGSGLDVDWVTGAALAMRREVWERCGPLDETFRFYCQDLDLCLRAKDTGWNLRVLPEFVVLHHQGATIERSSAAGSAQDPALLWGDLVRWAAKRRGARWARRVARILRAGGRMRLLGRKVRRLALAAAHRGAWNEQSLAYSRALNAVSSAIAEVAAAQGEVRAHE